MYGTILGVVKRHTRSLDNCSCTLNSYRRYDFITSICHHVPQRPIPVKQAPRVAVLT